MEDKFTNIESELLVMLMQQQLQSEASVESLASVLLDDKQYDAFYVKRNELMKEKLKKMIDVVSKEMKDINGG